jgi:hypothetical protein
LTRHLHNTSKTTNKASANVFDGRAYGTLFVCLRNGFGGWTKYFIRQVSALTATFCWTENLRA